MAKLKTINSNLNAFLDMLAYAEGTSTSKLTKNNGYDVIVTGVDGPEIFTDYSAHPFSKGRKSKKINDKGLTSNASGRYQFMLKDYNHYRDLLKLSDFGPESQDRWAIQLIKERGAIPLINAGKFDEAVRKVSNLWASLPGAGYGQPERSLSILRSYYLNKGGSLWKSSLVESSPPSSGLSEHGLGEKGKDAQSNALNSLLKMLSELFKPIIKLLKRN